MDTGRISHDLYLIKHTGYNVPAFAINHVVSFTNIDGRQSW